MKPSSAIAYPFVFGLLISACGPITTLEPSGSSDDGEPGDTSPTSSATTSSATTTPPPLPTDGPLDTGEFDTGEFDTGEPWSDLPEFCSTVEQDCPPGYKCTPWASDGGSSWNSTTCVEIAEDPGAPGEPCTVEGDRASGIDDCDIGLMCWDVDPKTNGGTCVPHCIGEESNPTCANRCEFCTVTGDGILFLCLASCDPVLQDCAPGEACYPVQDSFACAPDASPPDTGIGSPCTLFNGCPPGLLCLGAFAVPDCEGDSCCTPACPVDGADPCPGLLPGTTCAPWYEGGPPQSAGCFTTDPGACAVP